MNIGLVLSGGTAKGAYQVGFLQALNKGIKDTSIKVTGVSCASIGVFSGYAYAAGKIDELCDIWQNVHFDSAADLMYEVWFKHFLKDMIKKLVAEGDSLKIPMYTSICYLPFVHLNYFRLHGDYYKKWRRFLLGAASFPFLSGGIHWFKGQVALDGGTMDNIPVYPLLVTTDKPDLIMVLHFEASFKPRKKHLEYGVPIIDYDISINSMYRKHSFDLHHETNVRRIEDGYKYGEEICAMLFDNGKNDIAEILAAAEEQRERERTKRLDNVTLDTWVQRLNEICYPFISRTKIKICDLCKPQKAAEENLSYKEEKVLVNDKV